MTEPRWRVQAYIGRRRTQWVGDRAETDMRISQLLKEAKWTWITIIPLHHGKKKEEGA